VGTSKPINIISKSDKMFMIPENGKEEHMTLLPLPW
jgi:hypothetical protein